VEQKEEQTGKEQFEKLFPQCRKINKGQEGIN
jgi:hypothetical protein